MEGIVGDALLRNTGQGGCADITAKRIGLAKSYVV
jgi:hypothetical protein